MVLIFHIVKKIKIWQNPLTIVKSYYIVLWSYHIIISYYCEKNTKIWKKFPWQNPKNLTWHFIKILPFLQCAHQNTKQFISADLPSWAEQNSTNNFVVAWMVFEIFWVLLGCPRLVEGILFGDFHGGITTWYNRINYTILLRVNSESIACQDNVFSTFGC